MLFLTLFQRLDLQPSNLHLQVKATTEHNLIHPHVCHQQKGEKSVWLAQGLQQVVCNTKNWKHQLQAGLDPGQAKAWEGERLYLPSSFCSSSSSAYWAVLIT